MTVEKKVSTQQTPADEKVFTFPKGIPGFETYTTFNVFHKQENNAEAYWLESLAEPKVTFTLVDPTAYDLHYQFELSDEEAALLQTTRPDSCGVFLMLIKREDEQGGSAKLDGHIGGPLVINLANRIGIQKVISRSQVNVNMVES